MLARQSRVFTEGLLAEETAVVTGASRGIGEVIARRFADLGADVVLTARSEEKLKDLATEIERNHQVDTLPVITDVRDEDGIANLVEQATKFGDGTIEMLVANAGANFHTPLHEMSLNAWETIIDINLGGTFLCCNGFAEALSAADRGRVVTMSSIHGRDGSPEVTHYSASKAGVEVLTRSLSMEWAERNVRVNCVRSGRVITPGNENTTGKTLNEIDRLTVDRTTGHPGEIADLVTFLVSPAASYITGEVYTAEGVPTPKF